MKITGPQVRAARALVQWPRDHVARLSGLTVDALADFRRQAPGMPHAHPTVEHFTPLFITLGAASSPDVEVRTRIEGFKIGLSKRSIEMS